MSDSNNEKSGGILAGLGFGDMFKDVFNGIDLSGMLSNFIKSIGKLIGFDHEAGIVADNVAKKVQEKQQAADADGNANTSSVEEEAIYRLNTISRTLSFDNSAEATTARANIDQTVAKLRDGSLNLADNFSVASTGGTFGNTHDLALGIQTAYDPSDPLRSISVIAGFAEASVGLKPEEVTASTQMASAQTTAPPVEETPPTPVGASITLPKS